MDKFFSILNPMFNYVDSNKFFRQPFKWLYIIIGLLNILLPIYAIKMVSDAWEWVTGGLRFGLVLVILVAIALAYMGMAIWFKRCKDLNLEAKGSSRFVAIPLVANFIQTAGEWLGAMLGVGGFAIVLLLLNFGGSELRYYFHTYISVAGLVIYPIGGYIIVLMSRFLAEGCLALASIANSAKSIDDKLSEPAEPVVVEEETTEEAAI